MWIISILQVFKKSASECSSSGCLSPLRAFGDARFKLSLSELNMLEDRNLDLDNDGSPDKLILPFYRTPPYLIAKPQIRYHRLGVLDRALVIAR